MKSGFILLKPYKNLVVMQMLLFNVSSYPLFFKLAEGDLSALHYQNLSSIWCFLVPLHCLLFSESFVMDRSVMFSFKPATFFLIVFQSFLSPSFLLKIVFLSLFYSVTSLFLALKCQDFNSYQTRESECTLKVFSHNVSSRSNGFLFPASTLFYTVLEIFRKV